MRTALLAIFAMLVIIGVGYIEITYKPRLIVRLVLRYVSIALTIVPMMLLTSTWEPNKTLMVSLACLVGLIPAPFFMEFLDWLGHGRREKRQ